MHNSETQPSLGSVVGVPRVVLDTAFLVNGYWSPSFEGGKGAETKYWTKTINLTKSMTSISGNVIF